MNESFKKIRKSPEPKSSSKLSSLRSQIKDPQTTGDLDLSTDTTTSEVDRESINQLSERLKRLREKLYENRQELGSFDFGREYDDNGDDDVDDDSNEHGQEIEIINDDEKARREDNMDESSSESSENENERSDKTFTLGKATTSRRKEPSLPPPISTITIRPKDNRESFNTDSLDLKTVRLIEKR